MTNKHIFIHHLTYFYLTSYSFVLACKRRNTRNRTCTRCRSQPLYNIVNDEKHYLELDWVNQIQICLLLTMFAQN